MYPDKVQASLDTDWQRVSDKDPVHVEFTTRTLLIHMLLVHFMKENVKWYRSGRYSACCATTLCAVANRKTATRGWGQRRRLRLLASRQQETMGFLCRAGRVRLKAVYFSSWLYLFEAYLSEIRFVNMSVLHSLLSTSCFFSYFQTNLWKL